MTSSVKSFILLAFLESISKKMIYFFLLLLTFGSSLKGFTGEFFQQISSIPFLKLIFRSYLKKNFILSHVIFGKNQSKLIISITAKTIFGTIFLLTLLNCYKINFILLLLTSFQEGFCL